MFVFKLLVKLLVVPALVMVFACCLVCGCGNCTLVSVFCVLVELGFGVFMVDCVCVGVFDA